MPYMCILQFNICNIKHFEGPIFGSLNPGMPADDDVLSLRKKGAKPEVLKSFGFALDLPHSEIVIRKTIHSKGNNLLFQ